uniref:Uncharacterized protein n=1 Tax=Denticeps clupeoides TaxID=299321 RepID=A0AAY4DBH0_9TELE
MMGSKRQQSFMDPVPQSKAARLEGDVGAVPLPELSKSTDVPRYSSSQSAQYTGACLSYYLPGQERVDTASQWSRMCIRNSRSPLCHPTFTGASNTSKVVYGPDSAMSLGNSSPTLEKGLMLKQMFASYYSPSPGNCSPNVASLITPVAMKTLGGADHSQKMENPVSLAIPKPVYGPHPCFTELPCSTGPGYGLESRPHGVMPNIFDDEWFGHYGNVSSLHRRDPKGLMQQRELRSEHDAERIPQKEVTAEDCQGMGSAGLNRFSAFSHPSHDCYTCRPSRSGPTPERCQRFQVPTRAYYIPPSHLHNYDPEALSQCGISPEAYQDPTPDSRYMQIPQRNLLYNSRPHFDAESTSACRGVGQKYIEGVPPHQAFAPPFYTNLPLPSHLILRNFAPPHPAYQIHVNGEISTAPPQKYHMSVPNLQVDRPLDYSMQRTKPTFPPKPLHRLHGTPGILQSPFELDNGSFSNRSPVKRPQGPHLNRPAYPTGGCGVSATSGGLPDTPTSKLVICDQSKSKFMKGTFSKCGDCIPGSYMQCEDHGEADEGQTPPSPPMPVINNVFSLAPYKAYLDATGMLPPARQWQNDDHPMTPKQMKQDVVVEKEMKPQMDDLQRALCDNAYTEVKIKSEKMELEEIPCAIRAYMVKNVNTHDGTGTIVKKELGDSVNAESMLGLNIVVKSDCELKSSVLIDAKDPITSECRIQTAVKHDTEPTLTGNCIREDTPPVVSPPPVPTMPPQTSETDFCLQKIPPQALKITNFKMVLPKVLQIPASSTSVEILKSPVETKAAVDCSRQARHHFMELHQSLLRLLHNFMSKRPLQDLRTWLSHLNLGEPVYPPAKSQKISCLVGTGVRAVWFLDQELSAVLLKVLEKLRTYIASGSCPFPHVIRAGAIFVPMLLVKEVLFPQVPGTFIDQVLQEHRVELRPATLSEERHLTQLQKRACSSKLRRLLSLKHLPEVYPDVLNLLYYVSVNKVLDSNSSDGSPKSSQVSFFFFFFFFVFVQVCTAPWVSFNPSSCAKHRFNAVGASLMPFLYPFHSCISSPNLIFIPVYLNLNLQIRLNRDLLRTLL